MLADSETYLNLCDVYRAVVPIGACYAGTLWLGNAAYLYLSVSFIQMLKVKLRLISLIVCMWPDNVLVQARKTCNDVTCLCPIMYNKLSNLQCNHYFCKIGPQSWDRLPHIVDTLIPVSVMLGTEMCAIFQCLPDYPANIAGGAELCACSLTAL